jgi:hypothetical protein
MRRLLGDPSLARRLGENARRRARDRFGIERFARDWEETFARVTDKRNKVLRPARSASEG